LLKDLDNVPVSSLSWKSPLASQVISDEWAKIRKLPKNLYNDFMVRFYLDPYLIDIS
jgi:hypothetical protein